MIKWWNNRNGIKAASSDERALAVHVPRGMLLSGCATQMYSVQDPLHVWEIWSRWQIVCGSHNELIFFGEASKWSAPPGDMVKGFDKSCPQMLLAKFGANGSNALGRVGISNFIIFHKAWVGHGEAITRVSCPSDRPMWRYATLCVLIKMYRKLLFNNLSIVWFIKFFWFAFLFSQEGPQMLCAKFLQCHLVVEIEDNNRLYSKFGEFRGMFRHWKMRSFGTKKWSFEKTLQVVTWVSCHWHRPMWRYATLCVLRKMYRKLLFNNLNIVWNIKSFNNFLSGESTVAVCKVWCK